MTDADAIAQKYLQTIFLINENLERQVEFNAKIDSLRASLKNPAVNPADHAELKSVQEQSEKIGKQIEELKEELEVQKKSLTDSLAKTDSRNLSITILNTNRNREQQWNLFVDESGDLHTETV